MKMTFSIGFLSGGIFTLLAFIFLMLNSTQAADPDFPPRKPPVVIDGCQMQGVVYPVLLKMEDL